MAHTDPTSQREIIERYHPDHHRGNYGWTEFRVRFYRLLDYDDETHDRGYVPAADTSHVTELRAVRGTPGWERL
jgi:hypothetical protein